MTEVKKGKSLEERLKEKKQQIEKQQEVIEKAQSKIERLNLEIKDIQNSEIMGAINSLDMPLTEVLQKIKEIKTKGSAF